MIRLQTVLMATERRQEMVHENMKASFVPPIIPFCPSVSSGLRGLVGYMPAHITLPLQSQLIPSKSLHNPINIIVKMHSGAKDGRSNYEPKSSSTWFFLINYFQECLLLSLFFCIVILICLSHFFLLFYFIYFFCSPAVKFVMQLSRLMLHDYIKVHFLQSNKNVFVSANKIEVPDLT